uniref:Uncharacterized protein n=1 Tax=Rhizophora mucronata TaxID=61149 RepID=A0A2P2QPX3_RHIMU
MHGEKRNTDNRILIQLKSATRLVKITLCFCHTIHTLHKLYFFKSMPESHISNATATKEEPPSTDI